MKYVGQTVTPKRRLAHHVAVLDRYAEDKPKRIWIESVIRDGGKIVMDIVEEVELSKAHIREQHWIKYYTKKGYVLTNSREPGESLAFHRQQTVEVPSKPVSVRLSEKALKAVDEILEIGDDKDRTALIERLLKDELQRVRRRQRREVKEATDSKQ